MVRPPPTDSPVDDEPDGLEDETARVFLSYSRRDRENAQRIADVLRERHWGVFRDTDDILPTEEWKGRLEQLIAEADTIVFLLSPASIASEVCAWEVEYASSLGKRIAPIVIEEVDTAQIPPLLARLNFIFCTARDRFEDAADSLVRALNTDIDWIREHTRLAGLASRWASAGEPARLMLRGADIADAERWRDERPPEAPPVTQVQAAFISGSRSAATRRQRQTVTFAILGAVFAAALAAFAFVQREAAIDNAQLARENQRRAEHQRDQAQTNESLLLTSFAENELARGFPVEAALLALEALPDMRSSEPGVASRPLVEAPIAVLRRAERQIRELAIDYHHAGAVEAMSVSPDGRRLATVSRSGPESGAGSGARGRGELVVFDLHKRQVVRHVRSALVGTSEPAFDATGALLAVIGRGGEVLVFRVDDDEPPRVIDTGARALSSVSMAPDGTMLFASTDDDRLLAIDATSGTVRYERPGTGEDLSPDGLRLALVHESRVVVLDAATGESRGQSAPLNGPMSAARWLEFSVDGGRIAARSEHAVWVVDGYTGKGLGKAPTRDQSISAARLSADGAVLAVAGSDGRTTVYDLGTRKQIADYRGHRAWLLDLALDAEQSLAATAGMDGSIQVWQLGEKRPLQHLLGHTGPIRKLLLRAADGFVISAGEDGTVRRWHLAASGATSLVDEFAGDPLVSDDGQTLALSGSGIFDFRTGERRVELAPGRGSPHFLAFTQGGRALLGQQIDARTGNKPTVCVYALPRSQTTLLPVDDLPATDLQAIHCLGDPATVNIFSASIDPGGVTLAAILTRDGPDALITADGRTGNELGRVVFDAYAKNAAERLELSDVTVSRAGHRVFVRSRNELLVYSRRLDTVHGSIRTALDGARFFFSPDHAQVLALTASEAELWDTRTTERLAAYPMTNRTTSPPVFSPSGRYVASVDPAGTLSVRAPATGTLAWRFGDADKAPVEQPVFSADERYLLASQGYSVLLWDLADGQLLDTIRTGAAVPNPALFAKAISADGDAVITWSWAGPRHWPLLRTPQAIVEYVQVRVPRCLTPRQRRVWRLPTSPPRWCETGPGLEREANAERWTPLWPYTPED